MFYIVCLNLKVFFYLIACVQLQLGVDESYTLFVSKNDGKSIIGEATIEVI